MSTDDGNPAKPVRDEDAFDVAAVTRWLRGVGVDVGRDPQVRQFAGGASNLTYLLAWDDLELILRRPPAGVKAAGAHDMGREHRIQAALAPAFPLVPTMVGHCADTSVIGSEFYVMHKVEGRIPRRDLGFDVTPEQGSHLCANAWDVLVDLHSVDVEAIGDLAALGKGDGYVRRQVGGWSTRMRNAATDDLGDWEPVMAWLDREQPADVAQRMIHNDFRLDNLVLDAADPLRVVGVLDWEMATVGDPLMDLAGALAYWVTDADDDFFRQFRRQPSNAPGMWTREEIVDRYCARMGLSMDAGRWRFYEVFGLFRLAVIAQQIWYRYSHGQTTNETYAVFGPAVGYLRERCLLLTGRSDRGNA